MTLIACTRMYNVNGHVAALWDDLIADVARRAGIRLDIVRHAPPASLDALWQRPDLGLAFMCGWPWHRARPQPRAVAAPITVDGAGARYATHFMVRADSSARRLEDTFGERIGWTAQGSHSGLNAPRHHLLELGDEVVYPHAEGPLVTPRAVLDALADGRIDVGPLDSYWYWLLRHHEPDAATAVRSVARTHSAPVPLLVAGARVEDAVVEALRDALMAQGETGEGAGRLAALGLTGFAPVAAASYELAERWHRDAEAAGVSVPGQAPCRSGTAG